MLRTYTHEKDRDTYEDDQSEDCDFAGDLYDYFNSDQRGQILIEVAGR